VEVLLIVGCRAAAPGVFLTLTPAPGATIDRCDLPSVPNYD
jgi:hypothetical protein